MTTDVERRIGHGGSPRTERRALLLEIGRCVNQVYLGKNGCLDSESYNTAMKDLTSLLANRRGALVVLKASLNSGDVVPGWKID